MANVARRYRALTASRSELVERVAAWVPKPAAERSLLPPPARQHWGLMPALPLAAEDLAALGHFVASLAYDSVAAGMGPGPGMGGGMRMRHRGGSGR